MDEIQKCVEVLRNKQLLLYPTDTVWWIWWDATDEAVIQSVNDLKWFKPNRLGYVMLIHPDHILDYVDCDIALIEKMFNEIEWPVTFRFKNPKNIPDSMRLMSHNTVAMRIPYDNEFLLQLLKVFGKPIISTSANITNTPFPISYEDIANEIINWVHYIVDPILDTGCKKPSTIVGYPDGEVFR